MASWDEVWREQMDGIEDVEEHSDESWAWALALLLLLETRLRNRIARRIAGLPVDDAGRIDARRRSAVIAFRTGVRKDVQEFARRGSLALAGVPSAGVLRVPTSGVQIRSIRRAAEITEHGLRGALLAGGAAESLEQFALRTMRRERDIEDIALDAVENPSRQFAYESYRLFETIKGVGTRFSSPDAAMDYVLGSGE